LTTSRLYNHKSKIIMSKRSNNNRKQIKPSRKKRNNTQKLVTMNRGPGFMPPRMRTSLTFTKASIISNVGATFGNVVFNPTGVYDVDPLFGSTSTPGFAELAAIYRVYRVNSSRIKIGISNEQSTGITAYVVPVNFNPGANNGSPYTYLSDRLAKVKAIGGSSGNNTVQFSHRASTQQFAGVRYTGQIDEYTAAVTTTPVNNWYWMVGFVTNNASLTAAGVSYFVHIDMDVEFFELNNPSN
jgi:hypothetical protein